MPEGVEHKLTACWVERIRVVIIPEMPEGVEHWLDVLLIAGQPK